VIIIAHYASLMQSINQ